LQKVAIAGVKFRVEERFAVIQCPKYKEEPYVCSRNRTCMAEVFETDLEGKPGLREQ
jgi:hypothetical protein